MPTPFPLRCRDRVCTGFLVSDATSVWLVTCVHLVTGLVETPPDPSHLKGAVIEGWTVDVSIPLFDGEIRRFPFVTTPDGMLVDALAVKLTAGEAARLMDFGAYDVAHIVDPQVGEAITFLGFPGAAKGDNAMTRLEGRIDRVEGVSILLSTPSSAGMSGGPLLSANGLVGVVHGDIGHAPDLTNGLAITFRVVQALLFQ